MPASTKLYPELRNRVVNYKNAILLYNRDLPVWDTREIALFWPVTVDRHMEEALLLLDTYCSSKNANKQSWVKDPMGSDEIIYGTWRLVENRMSKAGEPNGIVQILREGWATTLANDEAIIKLGPIQGAPIEETYSFIRYWRNINPSSVEALALTLNATKSVTDPKVQGNTKSGTYAVSAISGNIIQGDGTGVIQQTLSLMTAVADADALDTLGQRKLRKNEILNLFGIREGEGDFMAFMFYGINPSSEASLFAISDVALVAKFAVGWTYLDRDFKIVANGTANFTIAFRKTAWLSTWSNKKEMSHSNLVGWGETENDVATGILVGSALDTAYAASTVPDAADKVVVNAQMAERANGEGVVNRTQALAYTTDETGDATVIDISVGLGNAKASVARVWRRRSPTAKDSLIGIGGSPTSAAISNFTWDSNTYTHSSARITDHPDGTYTVVQIGVLADSWFAYIPHDQTGPLVVNLRERILRNGAGVETYERQLVATYKKIVATPELAAAYADDSHTMWTDHATEAKEISMGWVDYLGKDKWAGYQVRKGVTAAPGTPWAIPADTP